MDALAALMKGPLPDLYFCIGNPVVGNPTQYMVEEAFSALNHPGRYLTCEVQPTELEASMWGLRALQFAGGNVTAPFKQQVFPFLDDLSESARLCQAVNCITRQPDGTYVGDNTDGKGFLQSLKEALGDIAQRKVILFGSGGAASAIATELVLAEIREVVLVNRSEDKAQAVAKRLQGISKTIVRTEKWEGTYRLQEDGLVTVQATSVGLFNKQACINVEFEGGLKDCLACDVVFNPVDTAFLQKAREAGWKTLDGLGMLVNQGSIAIRNWTGLEPDRTLMRRSLEEAFAVLTK
ncbi:MAG: shikimate dehydrogenase [Sphaerochaeta sp.]|uniref:shikimate dehydrogenase family protein n=1 Tax=Sphaerochaeta sp. TaxID=1972642 RepID=UPI003D0BEFAF